MKKTVKTERAPQPIGSQAVVTDGLVFLSGQVPLDPETGRLVAGGIGAQTERALRNVAAILEAAGCGIEDVIKVTVFLIDMNDFDAMNEAYGRFFKSERPARTTVGITALPRGGRVEIEVIARFPRRNNH